MRIRQICIAFLLPVLLTGCLFGGGGDKPARAPTPIKPRASGPVTLNLPTSRATQQCYTDLSRHDIRYSALPDRDYGGGCMVIGAVQLLDIGVPVTNLGALTCPLAAGLADWTRTVRGLAEARLGSPLARIESFGTFACRPVNNVAGGRLSEHAFANAVDVAAFVLADGRRITVLDGWNGRDERARGFLREAHRAGCRRFAIGLGPDANALHANHFHFDMGRGPYCR